MPPRRTRAASRAASASTSRRRRREPTPPPTPPPSPLPWDLENPQHQARYRVLHKREVIPSKFFDPFTVHNLGLRENVNAFVQNIGWTVFAGMNFSTFKEITFEILSSLRSTYHPHQGGNPPCIFFQCMGEERQLTIQDFNHIFRFPNDGINWFTPEFSPTQAWRQLTDQDEYNPRYSKASQIRNHSLRYLHRVMSMSIFGRGESTGVVNRIELLILWAMVNNVQVNTGAWFLKHLLNVAKNPTGKICVGGLLTAIAVNFGFQPQAHPHPPVPGSVLVDISTLLNMKMCRHIGHGEFRLLDDVGHIIDPPAGGEEGEAAQQEDDPQEAPLPMQDDIDMEGFQQFDQPPQQPWPMTQIMERFDQLEHRQMQMMEMLQQNTAAIARIEDRLSDRR